MTGLQYTTTSQPKAQKCWGMVSHVLQCEGLLPKVAAMFYKAVVQVDLLYGAEMWSISPTMRKALKGFHHQVAHQLTGKVGQFLPWEDWWEYPPIEAVLSEARLFLMEVYITCHQNCLVDYIVMWPIFDLCMESNRLDSSSRAQLWWEQFNVAAATSD